MPQIAICWFAEIISAGRFMSEMLDRVIAHLNVGAQKKIVKGPAGCKRNPLIASGQGTLSTAACNDGTIPILCFSWF